ncbi:MAG: alpha-galactosidase, partial [Oscillospiraceae bacterium]
GHRLEPSMMVLVSEASFSDAHETLAIPIIAGNLHRTIKPSQSQIWAVLRRGDNANRLYYSLCSTFLGRMCLSGDIYDLSDQQWNVVKNGIKFYNDVSDIIKNGTTIFNKNDVDSYNKPKGEQIVVRDFCDRRLVVVHRFENSENVSLDFLNGYSVISTFGSAEDDFSAMAWHLKLQG